MYSDDFNAENEKFKNNSDEKQINNNENEDDDSILSNKLNNSTSFDDADYKILEKNYSLNKNNNNYK